MCDVQRKRPLHKLNGVEINVIRGSSAYSTASGKSLAPQTRYRMQRQRWFPATPSPAAQGQTIKPHAVVSERIGERHASACRYKKEVPEGSSRSPDSFLATRSISQQRVNGGRMIFQPDAYIPFTSELRFILSVEKGKKQRTWRIAAPQIAEI